MKMFRKLKHFGRCHVPKHGDKCCLTHEIQTKPITKTKERKDWKQEAENEILDTD